MLTFHFLYIIILMSLYNEKGCLFMKKIIFVLLCICLLLSISACSRQNENDMSVSTTNTTSPQASSDVQAGADLDVPVAQQPMVSVSLPMQTDLSLAEDGEILLQYHHQYMALTLADPEVAHAITLEFLNRIDETAAAKDSLLAAAEQAYAAASKNWNPHQYIVEYIPQRIDNGVLSLLGCDARFSGAHMEKIYTSVNYSMVTGRTLSLYNILNNRSDTDKLCSLVNEVLSARATELYLFEDYETTVKQHFSAGINDAWYFSANGLCFFFSPYDIAPYSSGVVAAEIPYEKLTGILKDEYFPPERATAAGEIALLPFSAENQKRFTKFSELILETDADKFLLYTDKSAYDITIEYGTLSSSDLFHREYTCFALSSLTPGDAVTVEAKLTGNACLHLRYYSGDKIVDKYITADGSGNFHMA